MASTSISTSLVNINNLNIAFGDKPLLNNANFILEKGERVALIGRNGTGKTTLMKIISREIKADSGQIAFTQGLKVSRLNQEVPGKEEQLSIFDIIVPVFGNQISKILIEYNSQENIDDDDNNETSTSLEEKMLEIEGYNKLAQIDKIISQMELDQNADFNSLSIGLKRRVLLAKALILEPDLLLLDEPTNHLDIKSVLWLENFLLRVSTSKKTTLLFVTHDRNFLKKLSTRILDLDRGTLASYNCDYETYLERKKANIETEMRQNDLFDKRLSIEETWIRKGIKARRTRDEGRVRSLKKMRVDRSDRREFQKNASMNIEQSARSGRKVIIAKNISFTYETKDKEVPIFKNFSTLVTRGDKIGIIGNNGCGKTTLLKVLLGQLEAQSGEIEFGTKLELSYFDQTRNQLDEEKNVMENLLNGRSETLVINDKPKHVLSYLDDFLFSPIKAKTPVKALSGGEKNRLLLAILFSKPSNILILDEPTNDLDIETLELLENLLLEFTGTILLVSHDRTFINNIVTSTIVFEDNKPVKEYVGGYDDYVNLKKVSEEQQPEKTGKKIDKEKIEKKREKPKQKTNKLTFKEKIELKELPQKIENLEEEHEKLINEMADPKLYESSDKGEGKILTIKKRLEEVDKLLPELYDRWEEFEAKE